MNNSAPMEKPLSLKNAVRSKFAPQILVSSMWIAAGTIGSGVLSYVFISFVTHKYSVAEVGTYSVNLATTQLLGTIAVLGLDQGIVKFLATSRRLSRPANRLIIRSSALALALCALFALGIIIAQYSVSMFLLLPYMFGAALLRILSALARLHQDALTATFMMIGEQVARIVLFCGFVMIGIQTYLPELSTSVAILLTPLFYYLGRRKQTEVADTGIIPEFGVLFRFSQPLFWAVVTGYVLERLPVLLSNSVWSKYETGIVSIAFRIVLLLAVVPVSINYITGPKFIQLRASGEHGESEAFFRSSLLMTCVVSIIAGSLLWILSSIALKFFGNQYVTGTRLLHLLVVSQVLNSCFYSVYAVISVSDTPRLNFISGTVSIVVFIGVTMALSNSLGFESVGVGLCASSMVVGVINWFVSSKVVGFRIPAWVLAAYLSLGILGVIWELV